MTEEMSLRKLYTLTMSADMQEVNALKMLKTVDGTSVIHLAAILDKVCLVEKLLKAGVSVNSRCDGGNTPLNLAAMKGNYEMVCLLLENGADTSCRNNSGFTAYQLVQKGLTRACRSCAEKERLQKVLMKIVPLLPTTAVRRIVSLGYAPTTFFGMCQEAQRVGRIYARPTCKKCHQKKVMDTRVWDNKTQELVTRFHAKCKTCQDDWTLRDMMPGMRNS
jgi:hypothetical protein